MAADCDHQLVNTTYGPKGGVTAKCATCGVKVSRPHHAVMANLYRPGR